jgi:hypothetical protein
MTGGQSAVRMNDRHSFPVGGLVELSRSTYQSTPLAVVEIRPTVFSFIGARGAACLQSSTSVEIVFGISRPHPAPDLSLPLKSAI